MKNKSPLKVLAAFLIGLLVAGGAAPLFAATVTTLNDSGPGSLRAAIAAAAPGETIDFAVTGTLTLTSGELAINTTLTIAGPGANQLTIQRSTVLGTAEFRLINVAARDVVISGVTMANGEIGTANEYDDAAGILNRGGLTLLNCAVVGNHSLGNYTRGTGICNMQTATLIANECLFADNIATGPHSEGAALYNYGEAALTNCTISGNVAGYSAAVQNDGLATDGVIMDSCTLFHNFARVAAGIYNGGSSGAYTGKILLRNSIVAGNIATNASWEFENHDIENWGEIKSGGYNVIGTQVAGGPGFNGILFQPGDRLNVPPEDVGLAPLADNGGPTATHALFTSSPAFDLGASSEFPATDQRGMARPQFSQCDIGAFEADSFPPNQPPVVSILSVTNGQVLRSSLLFLQADASDPDGRVASVEYFAGTNSLGTVNNTPVGVLIPYLYFLQTLSLDPIYFGPPIFFPFTDFPLFWVPAPGKYVLTARATDNVGATTTSAPVEVTVVGPPVVTIQATDVLAVEPGRSTRVNRGTFTITRVGDISLDLVVTYFILGTAQNGVDYSTIVDWATIPAGRKSVQITIDPLTDGLPEETETVTLRLALPFQLYPVPIDPIPPIYYPPLNQTETTGSLTLWPGPDPYQLGSPFLATVYIRDADGGPKNHLPFVSITQPANGQIFPRGANVEISVDTADRDSYVELIEFFAGAKKIGEIRNELALITPGTHIPVSLTWSNAPSGLQQLRARATDTHGGVQVSPPVRIWVR